MALTRNNASNVSASEIELLKRRIEVLEAVLNEKEILNKEDDSWETVWAKRNYLLRTTDWTLTPGFSLDQAQWTAYRQVLRDLPQTYNSLERLV